MGVFIDFTKAFDCIDKDIFIIKLERLGVRGPLLQLMKSYLTNRKQRTYYKGSWSNECNIIYGAPQGSNLSPLIWQIYGNDLPNSTSMLLSLFVDDTNGFVSNKNIQELFRRANIELSHLYRWIIANKLGMNSTKLYYLLFNFNQDIILPVLKIGDFVIPRANYVKFLGLVLDEKLKWNIHIDTLCKKLSKLNGILYLVRNSLSPTALKCIYYSLVYSHLIYGISIWGGTYQTHLDPLIKAQKRIVRTISLANRDAHTAPLFNELHLLTFNNIYKLFTTILAFKCINMNYVTELCTPVRAIHQRNTRQSLYNLRKPPSRRVLLDKSVLCMVPSLWNSLPNNIKSCQTLNQFKLNVKLYLYSCQLRWVRLYKQVNLCANLVIIIINSNCKKCK